MKDDFDWLREMRDHAIHSTLDAIGIASAMAIAYGALRIIFGG